MSEINYDYVKEPLHNISQELFDYMNNEITGEEINTIELAIQAEIEKIQAEVNLRKENCDEKLKTTLLDNTKKKLIKSAQLYEKCMDDNITLFQNRPFKTQAFDLRDIENQRLYFYKVVKEINKNKKKYYDIFVEEYNKAKRSNPKLPNLPENFTWRNMRLSKGFEGMISDIHGDLTVLLYFIILSGIGDFIPGECSYLSLTNNTRYSQKEFDEYINKKYNLIKVEETNDNKKARNKHITNFKEEMFYSIPLIHINHDFDSELHLLGDHGDRGNATVPCLELIEDLLYMAPDRITNIVGNHEIFIEDCSEYQHYLENLYDDGKFLTVKSRKIGAKQIIDAHTFLTKKHLRELFTIYRTIFNDRSDYKNLVNKKLSPELQTKLDDFFRNISSDKTKENKFDYEYNTEQGIYNDVNSYNAAYDEDYENTYDELIKAGFTIENFLELKDALGHAYIKIFSGNDENDNDEGNNIENDNDNSGLYMSNAAAGDLTSSLKIRIEALVFSTRFMPENLKELLPLTIQFTGHNNMFYIYQIGDSYVIDTTRSSGFKTGYSNCNVLIYNPYTNFRYVFADFFQQTNLEPQLMDPKPLPPAISNKPNLYKDKVNPEESSLTKFDENDLRKAILPMFIDSIAPELENQVTTNLNQLFDNENLISTPEELLKFINNDLFESVDYKIDMSKGFKLNNLPDPKNILEIIQLKLAKNFRWNNDCLCALLSLSMPDTIAPELINTILQNFINSILYIEYYTLKKLIVLNPNSVPKEIMISLLEKIHPNAIVQITVEDVYDLKSYASNEIEIENSPQFKTIEAIVTILNSDDEINMNTFYHLRILKDLGEKLLEDVLSEHLSGKIYSRINSAKIDPNAMLKITVEDVEVLKSYDSDESKIENSPQFKKLEVIATILNSDSKINIDSLNQLKTLEKNSIPGIVMDAILEKYSSKAENIPQDTIQILENVCEKDEDEDGGKLKSEKLETLKLSLNKKEEIVQVDDGNKIEEEEEENEVPSQTPEINDNSDNKKQNEVDEQNSNLLNGTTIETNSEEEEEEDQTEDLLINHDNTGINDNNLPVQMTEIPQRQKKFTPLEVLKLIFFTSLGVASLGLAIASLFTPGFQFLSPILASMGLSALSSTTLTAVFAAISFVSLSISLATGRKTIKENDGFRSFGFIGDLFRFLVEASISIFSPLIPNFILEIVYSWIDEENEHTSAEAQPKNFIKKCLTVARNFGVAIASTIAHTFIFLARLVVRTVTLVPKIITAFLFESAAQKINSAMSKVDSGIDKASRYFHRQQTNEKSSIWIRVDNAKVVANEHNTLNDPLLPQEPKQQNLD